jgi:hypothetical protein
MYAFSRLNRAARRASVFCAPIALVAALSVAPAQAQSLGPIVVTNVQIVNQLGTNFDPSQSPTLKTGGSKESVYLGNYASNESELGLNYTATADVNSFFFLHDNYCVGNCATASSTVIAFTIQNQGDITQNVRFDSQITPGHLARIYQGNGSAGFDFQVLRFNDGFQTLYSANGSVNPEGIFLNTGNLNFNNQRRQTGDNYDLLDWDTTNLPVEVGTLAGGQSTTIFYIATYFSNTSVGCADVYVCQGAQVVFGDPRNNGGVNLSDSASLLGGVDANAETGRAVIGADYYASNVPFKFVNSDDPFSFEDPAATRPLGYDPLYKSRLNNVPEPATWAMMIGGFALLGAAARRRRVASVTFA